MKRTKKKKLPFDPQAFLSKVNGARTISEYGKDEVVYRQGDAADSVFYIQTGKAKVTVVSEDVEPFVAGLKKQKGKDIWLFGGGVLFRSLLEAGLVDRVEVAIIPVLLGSGIPLLPGLDGVARLKLDDVQRYEKTGTMLLSYAVEGVRA